MSLALSAIGRWNREKRGVRVRSRNAAVTPEYYKILAVGGDPAIIKAVKTLLKRNGYQCEGVTDSLLALEKVRAGNYDLLIMDDRIEPLRGDELVAEIRKFNREIYILFFAGPKEEASPLETIRALDIQGYCGKSDGFDGLLLAVECAVKSIARLRKVQKFRDGLGRILEMVPKIWQAESLEITLEEILRGVLQLVNSKNAFVLMDDITQTGSGKSILFKGTGTYNRSLDRILGMLDPALMEQIGLTRTNLQPLRLGNAVIFPIENQSTRNIGVLYVESPNYHTAYELLKIYVNQATSALNHVFLHSLAKCRNDELSQSSELETRYFDTIEVLRLAVDAKDVYTRGHSDRVAYYAAKIGQAFNLPRKDLELLRIGGIFHDIGKIGTAEEILLKTGRLTSREYQEIQKHPEKGANILSAVSMFKEVVPLIRSHHERIDGCGYPDRLRGDQIPFLARILAVADAFDAMTSNRLYRSKLSLDEAVEQLKKGAGTQFDPAVVERFIQLFIAGL